jgi:predicted Zn-dependent protease with MMP-like domain
MLEKIATIEISNIESHPAIENFIIDNKDLLEHISGFDHEEFNSLNKGTTPQEILLEREILRKFGSGQKA